MTSWERSGGSRYLEEAHFPCQGPELWQSRKGFLEEMAHLELSVSDQGVLILWKHLGPGLLKTMSVDPSGVDTLIRTSCNFF